MLQERGYLYTGRFSASSRNFKPWCCVYAAQHKNPKQTRKHRVQHRLGSTRLGSSSVEKALGVLGDKLNLSEQCADAADSHGCWAASARTSQQKQRSCCPTPLSTCQATPEILPSVLVPAIQKLCGQAGKGPVKSHNPAKDWAGCHMMKDWENCTFWREKALGRPYHHVPVFKGWLQGRWRLPFYKESLWNDKGKFQLHTRGKFFTVRAISRNNLSRE